MMMRLVFEQEVTPGDVKVEDGGQAKIVEFNDEDCPAFVRVQSWAEDGKHHLFDGLVGKRVRVTVETF